MYDGACWAGSLVSVFCHALRRVNDGLPLEFFRRPGSGFQGTGRGPRPELARVGTATSAAEAGRQWIADALPPSVGAGPPEKFRRPHPRSNTLDARLLAHLEGLDDV